MRFNSNLLVSFAGMSSVSGLDACDKKVVVQAGEEGFLNFALTECLAVSGTLNHKGKAALDAETCVSDWIAAHSTGNPIPSDGDCRDAYEAFVDSAKDYYTPALLENCKYDATSMEVGVTDVCVQKALDLGFGALADEFPLDDFRVAAGYYIGGNQCTAVMVTRFQAKHSYEELIAGIYATRPVDAMSELIDPAVDADDGLCFSCYHNFYYYLSRADALEEAETSGVLEACVDDPHSKDCIGSELIQHHLDEFKLCSGGLDLVSDSQPKAFAIHETGSAVLALFAAVLML